MGLAAAEEDPAEMGHGAERGGVFCVSLYFLMMIELCIAIYLLLHIGEGFVWRLKSCVNGGPGDNKAQGLQTFYGSDSLIIRRIKPHNATVAET